MGRQQRTSRSCLRESRCASSRAARRTRTANIAPQSQAIWSAIDRCHGGAHEYDGGTLCSGSMSLRRQSSSLGQSSACNWRTTRPATRALASTSGMSRAQRREKRSVRGAAAREWRPTRASSPRAAALSLALSGRPPSDFSHSHDIMSREVDPARNLAVAPTWRGDRWKGVMGKVQGAGLYKAPSRDRLAPKVAETVDQLEHKFAKCVEAIIRTDLAGKLSDARERALTIIDASTADAAVSLAPASDISDVAASDVVAGSPPRSRPPRPRRQQTRLSSMMRPMRTRRRAMLASRLPSRPSCWKTRRRCFLRRLRAAAI